MIVGVIDRTTPKIKHKPIQASRVFAGIQAQNVESYIAKGARGREYGSGDIVWTILIGMWMQRTGVSGEY